MSTNIDEMHYCAINMFKQNYLIDGHTKTLYKSCDIETLVDRTDFEANKCNCDKYCRYFRNKYPTPEQWEEENGMKLGDDAPVWYCFVDSEKWYMYTYANAKLVQSQIRPPEDKFIIVADPIWGRPPANWRPE